MAGREPTEEEIRAAKKAIEKALEKERQKEDSAGNN